MPDNPSQFDFVAFVAFGLVVGFLTIPFVGLFALLGIGLGLWALGEFLRHLP